MTTPAGLWKTEDIYSHNYSTALHIRLRTTYNKRTNKKQYLWVVIVHKVSVPGGTWMLSPCAVLLLVGLPLNDRHPFLVWALEGGYSWLHLSWLGSTSKMSLNLTLNTLSPLPHPKFGPLLSAVKCQLPNSSPCRQSRSTWIHLPHFCLSPF